MSGMRKKVGNLLIIQRWEAFPPKAFLLAGDSFDPGRYEITLQVFSYFKQAGCAFTLELHVPHLLWERLEAYGEKLGLGGSIMLENPPESPERYEEIIDVTEMFGQSVVLRKSGRIVNKTAVSLIESLKNSFEEKDG